MDNIVSFFHSTFFDGENLIRYIEPHYRCATAMQRSKPIRLTDIGQQVLNGDNVQRICSPIAAALSLVLSRRILYGLTTRRKTNANNKNVDTTETHETICTNDR